MHSHWVSRQASFLLRICFSPSILPVFCTRFLFSMQHAALRGITVHTCITFLLLGVLHFFTGCVLLRTHTYGLCCYFIQFTPPARAGRLCCRLHAFSAGCCSGPYYCGLVGTFSMQALPCRPDISAHPPFISPISAAHYMCVPFVMLLNRAPWKHWHVCRRLQTLLHSVTCYFSPLLFSSDTFRQ